MKEERLPAKAGETTGLESLLARRPVELLKVLEVEIQRYTMGESTSVRAETAEEIARSAAFCIDLYHRQAPGEAEGLALEEALRRGRRAAEERTVLGKRLLAYAKQTAWSAQNRSYVDTLGEIGLFFRRYDVWSAAHDVPCMIDYQLMSPPEETEGILYINDYLERLIWENLFCRAFEPGLLLRLYQSWRPCYRELLVNLCEPVLSNALDRRLLGRDWSALQIEEADRRQISGLLFDKTGEEIQQLLEREARQLCLRLGLPKGSWGYFARAARDIGVRASAVRHGEGLEGLFVCIK